MRHPRPPGQVAIGKADDAIWACAKMPWVWSVLLSVSVNSAYETGPPTHGEDSNNPAPEMAPQMLVAEYANPGRVHVVTSTETSSSVQFISVVQSFPTLCDPMNRSTPGLPVHHQLPEFTQTHIHQVGDAIQPSHPLSSPSPPAPNPSQHQSLFQ